MNSVTTISEQVIKNLKEAIYQLKEQVINKNTLHIQNKLSLLSEKITNLKLDPTKQELVSSLKKQLDSIKENLSKPQITQETKQQITNLENKINTPPFRVLFENLKVNSGNLQADLKATLLQIKEQIDTSSSLGKETVTKEFKATVEKVLSQIEFYQLVSYSSTSTTIPLSFLQEDIDDVEIKFNKAKKDNFSCQINLTLKKYGELRILLVLDKKNNININMGIHDDELKQIVQSSLQKLRVGINSIGISLQSLNIFSIRDDELLTKKQNLYNQNDSLSFGLDIKA
jgi:hypothetical protein